MDVLQKTRAPRNLFHESNNSAIVAERISSLFTLLRTVGHPVKDKRVFFPPKLPDLP